MQKVSLLLAAGALAVSYAHAADDVCSVGPAHCKVLKEDGKIRVLRFTAKQGDKIGMHSHPPHVVYIIKGGKTKFSFEDGTSKETEAKSGDALINPAVNHSQEHLSDVEAILVEYK